MKQSRSVARILQMLSKRRTENLTVGFSRQSERGVPRTQDGVKTLNALRVYRVCIMKNNTPAGKLCQVRHRVLICTVGSKVPCGGRLEDHQDDVSPSGRAAIR